MSNTRVLAKLEEILKEKKISFSKLAKGIDVNEIELRELLVATTVPVTYYVITIRKICNYLDIDSELFLDTRHDLILEKIKELLKRKRMTFVELSDEIGITKAGLYRAFHNQTLSLSSLIKISKALDVSVSYFFEEEVIERLSDEVMKYEKDPGLKPFMYGFSRDVSKGMKLEESVFKNLNPEAYKNSLAL